MLGNVSPGPSFSLPWIFLSFTAFTKSVSVFSGLSNSSTVEKKKKNGPKCHRQPWVANRKQDEPQLHMLGLLLWQKTSPRGASLFVSAVSEVASFVPQAHAHFCHSWNLWVALLQMWRDYQSNQFHKERSPCPKLSSPLASSISQVLQSPTSKLTWWYNYKII